MPTAEEASSRPNGPIHQTFQQIGQQMLLSDGYREADSCEHFMGRKGYYGRQQASLT